MKPEEWSELRTWLAQDDSGHGQTAIQVVEQVNRALFADHLCGRPFEIEQETGDMGSRPYVVGRFIEKGGSRRFRCEMHMPVPTPPDTIWRLSLPQAPR
jgi:hypothetical protein